jgi:hypothetical protein
LQSSHVCHACQEPGLRRRATFPSFLRNHRVGLAAQLSSNVGLKRHGHKDDLARRRFGHRLERLELSDLHGRGTGEDVGRLPHELGGLDLSAGGDDLRLTNPLLLRGGLYRWSERCVDGAIRWTDGERGGYLRGEDDVLDEDAFDRHAPRRGGVAYDLGNLKSNRLTFGDDGLHRTSTDDMTEGRLGTLDERLAQVADAVGGTVWVRDCIVDDRVSAKIVSPGKGNPGVEPHISISTLSRVMTCCRPIGLIWTYEANPQLRSPPSMTS